MCTNSFVTPATELATTAGFSIKFFSNEMTVHWMRVSVSDGVCTGTAASVAELVAVRPLHEAWMLGTEGLDHSIFLLGLWSTVVWDVVALCSCSGLVTVLDFFFGETCRLLVEGALLLDVLEVLLDTSYWLLMLLVFLFLLLRDVSRLLLSGSALLGWREQPPRGPSWVSGLVGHFVQTWPDSECSHTVQCLDCSDLNRRCNRYHLFCHGMTLLVLMCR